MEILYSGAFAGALISAVLLYKVIALLLQYVPVEKILKTAKPGDLIEIHRGPYCHWAMYSDEEGKVINIPAEGKDVDKVTITKEDLLEVVGVCPVRINNQERIAARFGLKKRSPEEAISAAKAALGKTLPYSFLGKNCECYCTEWLYGAGFSTQVNKVRAEEPILDWFWGLYENYYRCGVDHS